MLKIIILTLILAAIVWFLVSIFKQSGRDDTKGDPLDPEQIARRKQNLDKIMRLAVGQNRITSQDVQKYLRISDAVAIRYLEYLVNLNKLIRSGERGQQVFYQLPPR
jgi:predicted HTH transcriptional regulator